MAVQFSKEEEFKGSIEDLKSNIDALHRVVEDRETQNKSLRQQFEDYVIKCKLDKQQMSDKITNLEIELDKADNDIKELEELLRNKKRIANLLEGIHHFIIDLEILLLYLQVLMNIINKNCW